MHQVDVGERVRIVGGLFRSYEGTIVGMIQPLGLVRVRLNLKMRETIVSVNWIDVARI